MKHLNDDEFIINYVATEDKSKISLVRLEKIAAIRWPNCGVFPEKGAKCSYCSAITRKRIRDKFVVFYNSL